MQKGKQALLLHLGVCLRLCSTILLPCRCLFLLITLPHTPCTLNLFFFLFLPHSFHLSLTYVFSFPIPYPVWKTSISLSSTSFIFFLLALSEISPSHTPVSFLILSVFLSPPRHAPTLMWELRYNACGVVALAWGSVLRPRGVLLLLPLQTGGTGQCAGLGGWTAGGLEASGGQQRPQRSQPFKTLAPSSKVEGERGSCFWSRKRALVSPWLTKDVAMQPAKQTLPNNNPIVLLSCDYIFCVFMRNRNYYIYAAAYSNNIWCLFLINQVVSVHISEAVASDI